MKIEIWVNPKKADLIRRKGGDRFLNEKDIDWGRTEKFDPEKAEFTVAAYNGYGHESHYFDVIYKARQYHNGTIIFRKKVVKR